MRRVPRIELICPTCKTPFSVRPKDVELGRRYCSQLCAYRNKKPRVEKTCICCGKQFTISQYDNERGKGQFCSKRCRATVQNRTGHIEKVCPQCHRTFRVKPGRYFQKYCSLECSAASMTTRVRKTCEICGKKYETKACLADKSHYCSYECNGIAQQLAISSRIRRTKIEIAIADELAARNIRHVPQYVVGKCILDFALPEYYLGIECDGDYWHNRPGEQQRDKARDRRLKKKGWTVLRFSETEIKASPSACVDRVIGWLCEFAAGEGQLHLL